LGATFLHPTATAMIKLIVTSFFTCFFAICSGQSSPQDDCDTIHFQFNRSNSGDTTRVYLSDFGIADTTSTFIFGTILDRKSFKSIVNARITLFCKNQIYSGDTDKAGYFEIECFLGDLPSNGNSEWYMEISHPDYKCLKIFNPIAANYEGFKIKLRPTTK
jgi:hypothetical protein